MQDSQQVDNASYTELLLNVQSIEHELERKIQNLDFARDHHILRLKQDIQHKIASLPAEIRNMSVRDFQTLYEGTPSAYNAKQYQQNLPQYLNTSHSIFSLVNSASLQINNQLEKTNEKENEIERLFAPLMASISSLD